MFDPRLTHGTRHALPESTPEISSAGGFGSLASSFGNSFQAGSWTFAAASGPGELPLSANQWNRLGTKFGIDAVLTVEISAYGALNRRWTHWLIGSGIVEGTLQGWAVYKASGSGAFALAVAAEEIGQEVLTWGGGSYLFNKHFFPVILSATLASTADQRVIWSETVFASIDEKRLGALPQADQEK